MLSPTTVLATKDNFLPFHGLNDSAYTDDCFLYNFNSIKIKRKINKFH